MAEEPMTPEKAYENFKSAVEMQTLTGTTLVDTLRKAADWMEKNLAVETGLADIQTIHVGTSLEADSEKQEIVSSCSVSFIIQLIPGCSLHDLAMSTTEGGIH